MHKFFSSLTLMFALGAGSAFAADVVEFHIEPGTGSGPWNLFNNPVRVHVGETLRFINDDSISHFLHTDGTPCPHGTRAFKPGESYDCVITRKHKSTDQDLYDHDQGPDAQIYIEAE
jgi:hypothetical protein